MATYSTYSSLGWKSGGITMRRRVRMLQTRKGQHHPLHLFKYEAGKSYWLPETLAKNYIEKGIAIEDKSIDIAETKVKEKKKRKFIG